MEFRIDVGEDSSTSTDEELTQMLDFGTLLGNADTCDRCGAVGALARYDGSLFCEPHLQEAVVQDLPEEPPRPREGKRHTERLNCIGLD